MLLWQVSTHSRPKAAGRFKRFFCFRKKVSTHSRPKAAGFAGSARLEVGHVSTHSRPKAAGITVFPAFTCRYGFNTQPPEGGWQPDKFLRRLKRSFNTQPPEGGWVPPFAMRLCATCFNTQPPEGGWPELQNQHSGSEVSTHSRPKAAG